MDFAKTYILESIAFPGVLITLARMGPRRRAQVELSVSAARAKARELAMRHESTRQKLVAAIDGSPKDAEGKPIEPELRPECLDYAMELQAIADEAEALNRAEIQPAFVTAAVKAFGGEPLTYEGKPASAELLCEFGPDALFDECAIAINGNGYLAAKEAAPLSSRSISDGAAAGTTTHSIAPAANRDASS